MFEQVATAYLDLEKKTLVHLYKSLNQAQVSPGPGMVSQPASSFIFVFRNSPNEFEVSVGLHFSESGQRVLYKTPGFAPETVNEKVSEAEGFVGEMGFLMDNIRLGTLSSEERSEILRKIPFFYKEMTLYQDSLSTREAEAIKVKAETSGQRDAHSEMQKLFFEQYLSLVSML